MDNSGYNRRSFIKKATIASSFFIVPRHILGKGFIAPSDKLNVAGIGIGGKGFSDIEMTYNQGKENIVALCDIDKQHGAEAIGKWPKAKFYNDFRTMLEQQKDIDAVTISTPDHTHGVIASVAMQLGKHVYVQKPLAHNIYETRQLTNLARKHRIVSQMGNQGASNPAQQLLVEWFGKGIIGEVEKIEIWTNRPVWPQGIPFPQNKLPMPSHIGAANWDLFIGPAEYYAYDPLFHPFKWRGWWNFGTGALGDMGCHLIDPPFRVLELGYPSEVECSVGQVFTKDWVPENITQGCPPSSLIKYRFKNVAKNTNKDVELYWYDGGIKPFIPTIIPIGEEIGDGKANNSGVIITGTKGIMTCGSYAKNPKVFLNTGEKLTMPKDYSTENKNEKMLEFGHQTSWVEAIKEGYDKKLHKKLTSSFDYAGPLTETVLMGNLAIRSYGTGEKTIDGERIFEGRKKLLWDGEKMKILNYDEANKFVSRDYRAGWKLI